MTNIDITELLESYVDLLEKSGIPRESTESMIMLEAAKEIKKLREQLEFQRKLADENNKSRLRYQDVVIKGMELYEETCKNVREQTLKSKLKKLTANRIKKGNRKRYGRNGNQNKVSERNTRA